MSNTNEPIDGTGTPRSETKYGDLLPEDGVEANDPEPEPDEREDPRVSVGTHYLTVNDERDEIEKYNGLQWTFVMLDDGTITAVDCAHYCPGPGHTDPMGFRRWDQVPRRVQRKALRALNGLGREAEIVDEEQINEAAEHAL